ncbi:ABC transporter permease [Cardinium endosymbiont of Oedothorax gibbosus]|uniref:ABC transporter permease n=1 Tax=Cardinium endosymbiont of Oedothorax gibbosus TaxID=931101 RepID=UPI0020253ED6|nr:ABC transporter permease [Cardinium endosymbiont of Oedothorax gibbosus]CAH2560149.1 MacB-like periplasmic core domain-containing protein [Cardinium endosymbiont of Oedothorax gibbosus]
MLSFQTICWIRLVANRVRQRSSGAFSASIDKIVTLSITIGTASILIASMVMIGFQKEITKKITDFAGDFEITKYSGVQNPYEPTLVQVSQVSRLITDLPSFIEKVTAFNQKLMLIHTKVGVEGILCKGIDPMVTHKTLEDYLIAGRLPDLTKVTYQNELSISHHLAQKLSIQLGDTVVVHTVDPTARYRKLKIVGIYRTYLSDIDENLAFCDMRLMQRLNNWPSETVNGYTIFLKDHVSPTKALRNTILRLIDYDLRLMSTQCKYTRFYDWLAIIQKNTIIFIVFILLVAGCTMVATIMIQLMERSYMVGVLKVLGAYAWQIDSILLYNSLRTLCLGMVYGNILGIGLCVLQVHYRCITLEPALYYMRYVPIYSHWKVILCPNLLILGTLSVALYFTMKCLRQKKLIEAFQEG